MRVTTGNTTQMRRVSGGDSAHSQQELILHFGVAQNQKADVEVTWPSGTVQNFFDQPINQLLVIDESAGVLDQALTWSETTYDRGTRQLEVRAWTNYRGRTKLSAEGLGELRYNAAELAFEGTFDMTGRAVPESVRLTSERGKAWDLDVERIGVRSRFSGAFQR